MNPKIHKEELNTHQRPEPEVLTGTNGLLGDLHTKTEICEKEALKNKIFFVVVVENFGNSMPCKQHVVFFPFVLLFCCCFTYLMRLDLIIGSSSVPFPQVFFSLPVTRGTFSALIIATGLN